VFLFKKRQAIKRHTQRFASRIFILVLLATSIKLFLQAASSIPALSTISYTYRPIVIGYLHLVLLGIFTLFIIGYFVQYKMIALTRFACYGIIIFASGIILNELFLMLQGVSFMYYLPFPYLNEILFGVAILMLSGLILLLSSTIRVQLKGESFAVK
jgi:hypothetical protein